MKKYFFIAMLFSAQILCAVNVNSIINEFKDADRAEYVSVPWILMKMGHMFMDEEDKDDIAARIMISPHVLTVSEFSTWKNVVNV